MVKSSFDTSLAIKQATNRMVVVFRWVGLWPSKDSSIFYWMYGMFVLSTASFLFTFTMMFQLICFTKKEDLTENSFMALTELALFVKIVNFYYRYRSMQSHLDTINEFEFCTDAERKLFMKRLKFAYFVYMMDFIILNVSIVMTFAGAISAPDRKIAFPAWHPFDWENNTNNYVIVVLYQLCAMGISGNVQVVIQQYPSLMFYCISGQMEILSMRLRNMGHKELSEESSQVDKENLENISQSLNKCIRTHHRILEYCIENST